MERLLFPIKGLVGWRAVFDGLIRVFIVVTDHPALRSRQGGRTIQGDGLNLTRMIFYTKAQLIKYYPSLSVRLEIGFLLTCILIHLCSN